MLIQYLLMRSKRQRTKNQEQENQDARAGNQDKIALISRFSVLVFVSWPWLLILGSSPPAYFNFIAIALPS